MRTSLALAVWLLPLLSLAQIHDRDARPLERMVDGRNCRKIRTVWNTWTASTTGAVTSSLTAITTTVSVTTYTTTSSTALSTLQSTTPSTTPSTVSSTISSTTSSLTSSSSTTTTISSSPTTTPSSSSSTATTTTTSSTTSIPTGCREVQFTVSGSAVNRDITGISLTDLSALLAFFASAPTSTVAGEQTLVATYCPPAVRNSNNQKLQVLFSGLWTNQNVWQAQGNSDFPADNPGQYSWVQYANNQGYATLAVDRLGTGRSSHPDPVLVTQAPYEVALYVDLARQIRAGSSSLPQSYNDLTYVGNGYGSQLGAAIAGSHPESYNRFILTGFSNNVRQSFAGISLTSPVPAAIVDPARFGTLAPGYTTTSSETGRTNSFFGSKAQVSFDDTVADLFFQRKDVASTGQFVSSYAGTFDGTGFSGRVLVLTGEEDQIFCGPGSPVIGPASCGSTLANTQSLFPNADYSYSSVDQTGNAIQLHLSAQTVFSIAGRFLAGQTFP